MRVRIGCAVAVAVASVVLQACGDGGGGDAGTTLATPDTSDTPDKQVEPGADEAPGDVTAELPRTHYVDVELTDEGTVFGIMEGERVEIAGVEVHLQRGPADAWATMPTPDGRFITILVHGDFDVDLRALDGGLDPAATALAENLLERF